MLITRLDMQWLRRNRRMIYAIMVFGIVLGLGYTWLAAVRGDIFRAIIGSLATFTMLGAGAAWQVAIRAGAAAIQARRRADRAGRYALRLAAIASERSAPEPEIEAEPPHESRPLAQILASQEEELIRRTIELERIERRLTSLEENLVKLHGDAVSFGDPHWADQDAPPGAQTITAYRHLVDEEAASPEQDRVRARRRLRMEFASLIHHHDYRGALAKGDELVNRYPNSRAANDFRRVRPHLVRRIQRSGAVRQSAEN